MKNYIMGFLAAYTVLITAFAVGMYKGQIASISQACVERSSVAPSDYVSQIDKARK